MRRAALAVTIAVAGLGTTVGDARAQGVGGIDLTAFVDFYYAYQFNKTDPELHTFDAFHNSFSMSLAEVALEKMPTATSRVGGRIDLDFGPAADIVGSTDAGGTEVFKHIQQAYISMIASDNLTIDVGKFVTPIGAEVIESQDNWNYTRSILFGYAIPFQHTGVRATLTANDQVTVSGFLLNGWNNSIETNSDKTFAAQVAFTPNDRLGWVGNIIAGKEDDFGGDADEDLLWLFDTTVSYAVSDIFSLMGNFDYGSASNWVATDENGTWWGLAAYARYQAQDDWALAGRFEYIDDSDGGFMTIGEKAQSFTVTSDHTVLDDLIARIEFRVDNVAQGAAPFDYFTKDDGSDTGNQPGLTVGLVYALN